MSVKRAVATFAAVMIIPASLVAVANAADDPSTPTPYRVGSTKDKNGNYSRNEDGQSYGSELDTTTPEGRPDLIQAWATNGRLGYVKKAAFDRAVDQGNSPKRVSIPVYDETGKNIIGEYEITPPQDSAGNKVVTGG